MSDPVMPFGKFEGQPLTTDRALLGLKLAFVLAGVAHRVQPALASRRRA